MFVMTARIAVITLTVFLLGPGFLSGATAEETARSYFDEGMEMNKLRRFDEAIDKLIMAVRLDSENNKYHQSLFMTYLSTRHGLKGIEEYKKLALEFPKSPVVHYWLGRFYLQSQSLDDAAREFQESARLSPKDEHPWISLGHVYYRMGKDPEAMAAYREANRLSPRVAVVHGGLGNLYAKQNQLDNAQKEFEEALRIDPSMTEIRYNLSLIYEKKGKTEQAMKEWRQILDDDPNETGARERLAGAYYRSGKYADAVYQYSMLSELRQESPDVFFALGESQILLAASLDDSGDRVELMSRAAESFKRVLELDPKNEAAKKYLERLSSKDHPPHQE